jgi:glycine hydroxymethyltransferase
VTTRGFKAEDSRIVANFIADMLDAPGDEALQRNVAEAVHEMMKRFPLPGVRD